ncbi:MAG: lipid A deacylase LpxR family protein [Lentisphaeria bacterium]|jgi:hypothetical protein|nr:lipid A deacylase LpxR family protein [Lentisphaeria bacterium]
MKRCLFLALLTTLATQLAAEERKWGFWFRDPFSCSVHFDNDLFVRTDRYYTNGMRVSLLSEDIRTEDLPGWTQQVYRWIPFFDQPDYLNNIGLALGQNIYTPRDITIAASQPDDHPWGGWLYLGLSLHHKSDTVLHKLELQFGIVGPDAQGEEAQKFIHRLRGLDTPEGWDNQLRTEPGVRLSYLYKKRIATWGNGDGWGSDFMPDFGVTLGNIRTDASLGATLRAGWRMPRDFHSLRIDESGYVTGNQDEFRAGWRQVSFFVFAGLHGYAVAHDLFLDGNTFRDGPSVDRRPFVGTAETGVGVRWGRCQLVYAHVMRSLEFDQQDSGQQFGSITATCFF